MKTIEQGLSSIHFKFVTTACLDAIDEVKDSEQACKQVKHDIKTSVIPLISLISSEPFTLSASDLVPAMSIIQGITQPPNDGISQPFTVPALDSSSATSIPSVMTQLPGDEIFKHSTSPAFDSSSAITVSSITRQLASDGNSAETSPAALQQQSVMLILCQTSELSGVMTLPITSVGKSEHHVFITLKSTSEVSMSMTSFFQKSAMILSSLMTFIMILLVNVDSVVSVVNNAYSDKNLKIITKPLKSVFQYSLFNCVQFSKELKLLNDYFEDYKTDADLNKNILN